jgi:2-dehydro-3-deoxyphosphogluconate aldolase / (4S)-4-hydroxy-2-oxoglutarate aldolase
VAIQAIPSQGPELRTIMPPLFEPEISRQIADCGIVAVLILDRVQDAVPVARSLVAGGVTAMELTLRTAAPLEALETVRAEVPARPNR